MTLPLQKLREATLVALYALKYSEEYSVLAPLLMEQLKLSRKNTEMAIDRSKLVFEKEKELDVLISKHLIDYEVERVSSIEKLILRLAVFEMLFDDSIPDKVTIAEAIRLARKFSTPDSGSFVNGILDSIYKAKESDQSVYDIRKKPKTNKEKCIT